MVIIHRCRGDPAERKADRGSAGALPAQAGCAPLSLALYFEYFNTLRSRLQGRLSLRAGRFLRRRKQTVPAASKKKPFFICFTQRGITTVSQRRTALPLCCDAKNGSAKRLSFVSSSYNDYMMAKSLRAFRRAALPRSKTARLFCHILIISMTGGRRSMASSCSFALFFLCFSSG